MSKERTRLSRVYGQLYSCHFHDSIHRDQCFYCGEKANTLDHCPPLSTVDVYDKKFWKKNEIPFVLVPSCVDCNSILNNRPLFTLQERVEFIENKLLRKYEKEHNLWTDDEINQMGYSLQVMIKARKENLHILLERVRFAQNRVLNYESFPRWNPEE